MSDPAVLFYTKDFLTGTAFFSDAERGQYIRLLCEQHQNGHIPENHLVSVSLGVGSPVFKKFTKDADGNYYNKRMELEIIKRKNFTESRTANGIKGGRPRKQEEPLGKPLGYPSAEPNGKPTDNLVGNGDLFNDLTSINNGVLNKSINKKNGKKQFIPPTLEEVKLYFKEKGYKESVAQQCYDSYSVANWHDTQGSPVLNWKQKVINNWFREDRKISESDKRPPRPGADYMWNDATNKWDHTWY